MQLMTFLWPNNQQMNRFIGSPSQLSCELTVSGQVASPASRAMRMMSSRVMGFPFGNFDSWLVVLPADFSRSVIMLFVLESARG
jgi:hypothetical protein